MQNHSKIFWFGRRRMLLCSRFTGLPILSKERAVRINVANATGGHLDSYQYCRRFQKRTRPDKIRVLNIAQGSLEKSQYYRILTRDLHYADTPNLRPQLDEVSQMLDAYIRAIKSISTVPRSSRLESAARRSIFF
jgi:23S rRNA-intervening sequence protein